MIKKLAIYCGSHIGISDDYRTGTENLADALSAANITLVYGGAKVGLMNVLADRMLQNGASVIGVMPKNLVDREIAHERLTKLEIVDTMHERKSRFYELADAFIMLPGGSGSLDEFFEIMTWAQLGMHGKPFGILNISGYFDKLLQFLDHAVLQGFLRPQHRNMMIVAKDANELMHGLTSHSQDSETTCFNA